MDVFIHIPKSSGSTIRRILSREYGNRHILYFEPGSRTWEAHHSGEEPLQVQIAARGIRLITGHLPFGVHETIKEACRYFSMVRDPVARAVSEYYYAYSYPHHRLRHPIRSGRLSLDDFMAGPEYVAGGGQCAMLAGGFRSRDGITGAAIENVRHGLAVVGTTERFEESILLIARTCGWQPPLFVRTNVTKLDADIEARREQSTAIASGRYREYFRSDYAVYRAVETLLTERIAAEGVAFQHALEALREIQQGLATHAGDAIYDRYEFEDEGVLSVGAQRFIGSQPYRRILDYLGQPAAAGHSFHNFSGHVDVLSGRTVSGWALDVASGEPIEVTVRHGDHAIVHVRADRPRPDLLAAGFRSQRAGFRTTLDQDIRDPNDVDVCFGDTSLSLRR